MADISKIRLENETYNIKDENARNNITNINSTLNKFINKKYLLVGDSYGEGYSPDGNVESWCIKFRNYMGLDSTNCTILVAGGYGFGISNNFTSLIQSAVADNGITDIIVLGGYNDRFSNFDNIKTGIQNFKNACAEKFPNGKIKIGFVGWSNNSSKLFGLRSTCINYLECCKVLNIPYLNNIDYSLHEYFRSFSSDDFHPNAHGQEMMAKSLVNAINTGNANVIFNYSDFNMAMNYNFTTTTAITSAITMNMINNIIYFALKFQMKLDCNNLTINCNDTKYNVGDITGGLVIGNTFKTVTIPVNTIVHASGNYYATPATILIDDKKIKIAFYSISDDLHYFRNFTNVTDIQIQPFSTAIDASIN